ncbi:unnamed protein product [Prorocentrum cordatum]|uniref:EF-hand domain-containing protein n=1 Tax=Prorocentrum cordatum TaxID=2364126 RepID=A0ABN9U9A7_9DINO|nr:unnamed protein product [Polarella glacialis]
MRRQEAPTVHQPDYRSPRDHVSGHSPRESQPLGLLREGRPQPPAALRPAARREAPGARVPHRARVEQEAEIRAAFDAVAVDGRCEVGYRELKAAMRALGLPTRKTEVLRALHEQGCQGPEYRLGREEFAEALRRRFAEQDPLDAMLKSFRLFDQQGSGRIQLSDLQRVAFDLDAELGTEALREMIRHFNLRRDGEIDETEFIRVMSSTSLW